MEEEKINVFEMLSDGFEGLACEQEEQFPAQAIAYRSLSDLFRKAIDASEAGDPVAWTSFSVPPELFWAMDIVPLVSVGFAILGSFPGVSDKYLDMANEYVPDYICSTNRLPFGLALSGDVPSPDMFVVQNAPCDSIMGIDSAVWQYFGLPHFGFSTPYITNEAGINYTAGELKKLIAFLEKQTGRKMDFARLQQCMEYSNQAHELLLKINDLVSQVPCPLPWRDSNLAYVMAFQMAGTPEFVDYLQKTYEYGLARAEGRIPYQYEEKVRLVWTYAMPAYEHDVMFSDLEEEYGAINITYMNNNMIVKPTEDISNLDGILKGLARKALDMPMTRECRGPWEDWGQNSVDMLRFYKGDGAIFAGHLGCKANWGAAKLVKDRVMEELNVPTINVELDYVDGRITPGESIRDQLENFMSVVLKKKEERSQRR